MPRQVYSCVCPAVCVLYVREISTSICLIGVTCEIYLCLNPCAGPCSLVSSGIPATATVLLPGHELGILDPGAEVTFTSSGLSGDTQTQNTIASRRETRVSVWV